MIQLRPYQEHDLEEVRVQMREHRSVLLVEPTGAGKGTLASHIVRNANERGRSVLFLVNRRTLVRDMSGRLDKLGLDHGIVMGDDPRRRAWLSTHIASIDTLHRRPYIPHADLLILDEAHFAVSPIWSRVLERYPDAKILGMTATPIRLDGRGLGEVFESMVQGPQVQQLIDMGYLVPSRLIQPPGAPNVSGVRMVGGDFNRSALAEVCDQTKIIGNIVKHWTQYASDRKTVSFGVHQKHAQNIAERFRTAGISCAYVDAETPDAERDRIWKDLDEGQLRVVSSVGVVSYGWDHPIVSCVIGARPTASIGLWLQQVGRGSRPYPGKENLLVLDHAGNSSRLDVLYEDDRVWSLEGEALKSTKDDKAPSVTICVSCYRGFKAGPKRCPWCGALLPVQFRHVLEEEGVLEERKRQRKALAIEEWRRVVTGEQRREKFLEFRRIAKERGYSPKWPQVKYKVIFGQWPKKEWIRV